MMTQTTSHVGGDTAQTRVSEEDTSLINSNKDSKNKLTLQDLENDIEFNVREINTIKQERKKNGVSSK